MENQMTFKKTQIIMLPTKDQKALLLLSNKLGLRLNFNQNLQEGSSIYQHLYFVTDEKIKVGDWYIVELFNLMGKPDGFYVEQCKSIIDVWVNSSDFFSTRHIGNCKKIIATSDSSLGKQTDKTGIPHPSEDFIKAFVEEYNKNNTFKSVDVGYDEKSIIEIEKELDIHGHDEGLTQSEYENYCKSNSIYKPIVNSKNEIVVRI